ncbi:hypothetical protein IAR55_006403 [Kwoniella newhampshirensis]|uniref:Cep57 centrosome microtubule-binding domain-containing protein n=1 Tax=Kwoniella newhampshirensis TaxID=1651941 RepID=A0AAW0YT76_9TREE
MTKDAASHDHNIQFDFAKRDYQKDKNPYADITFPSALVKKGEDRSEQRKQPQDSRPGRFQSETRATVPTKEGSRHAAYTQTSARSAPRQQRPQDSEQLAKGNAQDSSNIKQPSETQPSRSTQRGRPKESTDSAAMQFRNGFGRQELIPKVEQAVNPMMPGQTRGAMNPPNVYPTAYHHPHDPIPSSINAENVSETQVPREDLSSPRHTIPSGKPSEQLSVENDNHSSSTLPQGSKQIKVFASELSFAKEESAVHPTHKPSPVTPHEPYRLAVVPRDMFRSQTQLVGGRSYPDQNRPQGPMTAHMPGVYSSSQQIRVKQEEESETELLNVIKKKSERIAVLDAECQHLKTAYKGLQDELALEVQKYLSLQKRHQQDEQNWRTSLTNVREWSEKVKERWDSRSSSELMIPGRVALLK